MSDLALLSLAVGVVLGPVYLLLILFPAMMRRGFLAFSRNLIAGWVLSALSLFWASWHLYGMSLGMFDNYKHLLFIIAPVVFILIVVCMDELLAARSLGAIMVLVPAPILDAARMSDTSWRLIMVVLAYIMALKGIFYIFSPYLIRKSIERFMNTDRLCRIFGSIGLALMIIVILLALTVY